jgi:hypothetical protein
VADGGGLENRYGVTPIVGSNPTPSARLTCTFVDLERLRAPATQPGALTDALTPDTIWTAAGL